MPPDLADIRRWIAKSHNDRRMAEAALDLSMPIPDAAAFHCQQAVEKLLKAFLAHREQEFEKIHDLRALCLECATLDASFEPFVTKVAPLTAYAVRFRYPGTGDPTVEEVREALSTVAEVWDFVIAKLPRETHP